MKTFFKDKRIIVIYLLVIFSLIFTFTYAIQTGPIGVNVNTALIGIDEAVYGENEFDSSQLDFRPILDSDLEISTDKVINIDFKVGGASTNNASNIIYDIALDDLEVSCNLLSPYIKWKLIKDGVELSSGSLDYKFDTIKNGRLVLTTIQEDLPIYNASQTGYHNYTFYMWFSDSCQNELGTCIGNNQLSNQTSLLGQQLKGRIEVQLYTESKKALVRNPEETLTNSECINVE